MMGSTGLFGRTVADMKENKQWLSKNNIRKLIFKVYKVSHLL